VADFARLLRNLIICDPALASGQGAQGRPRDVRPLREHLQRADQTIAAEQSMKASRIAGLHGRGGRVRPSLGR
jgi:hypothetical protein